MKRSKREDIDRDSLSRLCNLLGKHKARLKEICGNKSNEEAKLLRQKISDLKCSIAQIKYRLKEDESDFSRSTSNDRALPHIYENRNRATVMRSPIFGHTASIRGAYDREYNYPGCTE